MAEAYRSPDEPDGSPKPAEKRQPHLQAVRFLDDLFFPLDPAMGERDLDHAMVDTLHARVVEIRSSDPELPLRGAIIVFLMERYRQ